MEWWSPEIFCVELIVGWICNDPCSPWDESHIAMEHMDLKDEYDDNLWSERWWDVPPEIRLWSCDHVGIVRLLIDVSEFENDQEVSTFRFQPSNDAWAQTEVDKYFLGKNYRRARTFSVDRQNLVNSTFLKKSMAHIFRNYFKRILVLLGFSACVCWSAWVWYMYWISPGSHFVAYEKEKSGIVIDRTPYTSIHLSREVYWVHQRQSVVAWKHTARWVPWSW